MHEVQAIGALTLLSSHSPTSWKALWTNHIDSSLDVQADLVPSEGKGDDQMRDMIWSVRIV